MLLLLLLLFVMLGVKVSFFIEHIKPTYQGPTISYISQAETLGF